MGLEEINSFKKASMTPTLFVFIREKIFDSFINTGISK